MLVKSGKSVIRLDYTKESQRFLPNTSKAGAETEKILSFEDLTP